MLGSLSFRPGIARPLKELRFDIQARKLIQEGVDELVKAVVITLGPKARNAMIEQAFGPPKVTKDGVTVAREIEFKDAFRNMGAQLVNFVLAENFYYRSFSLHLIILSLFGSISQNPVHSSKSQFSQCMLK
jgi:hypothetical protein